MADKKRLRVFATSRIGEPAEDRLRERGYDLEVFQGPEAPPKKLIILNSPQNPTGGVMEKSDVEGVARAIGDRDIMVLTDEIYSRLIFEGHPVSLMLGKT